MNIQGLLKQAQQMQANVNRVEKELSSSKYIGTAGGEAVKVEVNGSYQIEKIDIKSELLNKDSKEMVEELVMLAVNNAMGAARADREEKMGAVTQGIKLPGAF